MTRYRVPVSDPLLEQRDFWQPVEGFRLVSVDGPWQAHPDVTICTFEDDGAPAEFEGKLVTPGFQQENNPDGSVRLARVMSRSVIPS